MTVLLIVAAVVLSTAAVVLSFSLGSSRRWVWLPQVLTAVAGTLVICALIAVRADYEWVVAASALTGASWLLAALRWGDR